MPTIDIGSKPYWKLKVLPTRTKQRNFAKCLWISDWCGLHLWFIANRESADALQEFAWPSLTDWDSIIAAVRIDFSGKLFTKLTIKFALPEQACVKRFYLITKQPTVIIEQKQSEGNADMLLCGLRVNNAFIYAMHQLSKFVSYTCHRESLLFRALIQQRLA